LLVGGDLFKISACLKGVGTIQVFHDASISPLLKDLTQVFACIVSSTGPRQESVAFFDATAVALQIARNPRSQPIGGLSGGLKQGQAHSMSPDFCVTNMG
jgi:hypothetical protein